MKTLAFALIIPLISGGQVGDLDKSVETIYGYDKSGKKVGSGTAFAVSKNRLLTAEHVCDMVGEDGFLAFKEGGRLISFRILKKDKTADLCLLGGAHGLKPLKIAKKGPETGDIAATYGSPLGVGDVYTEGRYGPIIDKGWGVRRQLSLQSCAGNSGGPVLNEDGEVTGVLVEAVMGGLFASCGHITFSPTHGMLRSFMK